MKGILLILAACFLFVACDKNNSTTTATPQETPVSVNGFFSVQYDTAKLKIDSMQTYFLGADGILDSAIYRATMDTTADSTDLGGLAGWASPERVYRSGDSAYAMVFAWSNSRITPAVPIPRLTFSEDVVTTALSDTALNTLRKGKKGFKLVYGFRLK